MGRIIFSQFHVEPVLVLNVAPRLYDELRVVARFVSPSGKLDVNLAVVVLGSGIVPGEQPQDDVLVQLVYSAGEGEGVVPIAEGLGCENLRAMPPAIPEDNPQVKLAVFINPYVLFSVRKVVWPRTSTGFAGLDSSGVT